MGVSVEKELTAANHQLVKQTNINTQMHHGPHKVFAKLKNSKTVRGKHGTNIDEFLKKKMLAGIP